MKKAACKADFLLELWGTERKHEYLGSQIDLDTDGRSGPPTFKPGLSSEERGKFFEQPEHRVDRTLDRYLKELCEVLERECADYGRDLEELIRFHIKEEDK